MFQRPWGLSGSYNIASLPDLVLWVTYQNPKLGILCQANQGHEFWSQGSWLLRSMGQMRLWNGNIESWTSSKNAGNITLLGIRNKRSTDITKYNLIKTQVHGSKSRDLSCMSPILPCGEVSLLAACHNYLCPTLFKFDRVQEDTKTLNVLNWRLWHLRADPCLIMNFKCSMVLGERKFDCDEWHSSILDSVVGAYLTQNVTDALSSKAFMTLASKFPATKEAQAKCIDSIDWKAVSSSDIEKVLPA